MDEPLNALPMGVYPWQTQQWSQLQKMIQQQHLPHALIVGGVPGLGKLSFVNALVATLLCQNKIDNNACGHCKSCQLLAANSHPDFKLLQPAEAGKAILVDQVRNIQHSLATTAQQGGARVVVINGACDLNLNSANALLKQLEEPGDHSYFLLIHQWPKVVLPTVRSRCQLLEMAKPTSEQGLTWLQQQLSDNELTIEATESLLQLANGAPLKALELYASKAQDLRHQMLVELTAILRGQKSTIEVAQSWQKKPLVPMLNWWIEWLNDLVKLKMTQEVSQVSNKDIVKLLQAVAKRSDIVAIYALLENLIQQLNFINQRRNLNPQLVCEELLHQWYLLVKSGH
ncbi:MAG: DNA polymerase III subunit delta' [Oceanospirillaceae bacterium]|nr:DNA polymerase III subunit delta' [Oceanospirillaceae bacterium]